MNKFVHSETLTYYGDNFKVWMTKSGDRDHWCLYSQVGHGHLFSCTKLTALQFGNGVTHYKVVDDGVVNGWDYAGLDHTFSEVMEDAKALIEYLQ